MISSKRKGRIDDADIISIVNAELINAPMNNNLISPLEYYLGKPNGTEVDGRSQITSTDVADSLEWIIPQIMKSFTQNNEIVIFDPQNEEDELQAELESEFVYNILMKKNDGFILIHEMVKDALLQRNGVLKVFYENEEKVTASSYTGLSLPQLQMLVAQKNVEVLEHEEIQFMDDQGQLQQEFNVNIRTNNTVGKIKVVSVPLEELRVNSAHNSINLDSSRFTAHVILKTVSELIEEGVDPELLDDFSSGYNNSSIYRFQLQDEQSFINDGWTQENPSMRLIQVIESYCYIDINNDGIGEYVKVTGIGGGAGFGTVATISHVLSVEEIEDSPWVATTGILMPHKFQGLSIYDRIKEIQDHKTALLRNIQDNVYLQNNQRNMILEGQVNIDDIVVSRPGGNIRVKRPDAMVPIVTPQLGQSSFDLVKYLDETRAGRTGVSAEGGATPQNIGDRVGSEGVDRMMNAKEELVGLIIRVIAETGIKPLMLKIRDLAKKHVDTIEDFKFRGRWVKVNPSFWNDRSESTVRVGTGTGDTRAKIGALTQIIAMQKELAINPQTASLVDPLNFYSAVDELCKLSGLNGASKYFIDPTSPQGQQKTQQSQQQIAQQTQEQQAQQQAMFALEKQLADAETSKAKAQQANIMLKSQVEKAKHDREMIEQSFNAKMEMANTRLEQANIMIKNNREVDKHTFAYDQLATNAALKLTEIEANAKTQEEANFEQNKKAVEND